MDIIVTSPPYGDSRTTVAYGQFSRLSSEWLDFKEAAQVDRMLMGGDKNNGHGGNDFKSEHLRNCLAKIAELDKSRVKDVVAFYSDYMKSINNIGPLIKIGGHVCYVVGNRKVKGTTLPTDEITIDFFKPHGFRHIETIVRNIPNKRMPSMNSPTNIPGKLDPTMTNEYIVVFEKIE